MSLTIFQTYSDTLLTNIYHHPRARINKVSCPGNSIFVISDGLIPPLRVFCLYNPGIRSLIFKHTSSAKLLKCYFNVVQLSKSPNSTD